MSFVDRAINAATDAARSSTANYHRAQRRRDLEQQITAHQQAIHWALGRIGELTVASAAAIPPPAQPAVDAIRHWTGEVAALSQQVAALDAQLAGPDHPTGFSPTSGYGAAPPPPAP